MDWRELTLDNSNDLKSAKLPPPISNWRRFGQFVIRQMPSSRSLQSILKHFLPIFTLSKLSKPSITNSRTCWKHWFPISICFNEVRSNQSENKMNKHTTENHNAKLFITKAIFTKHNRFELGEWILWEVEFLHGIQRISIEEKSLNISRNSINELIGENVIPLLVLHAFLHQVVCWVGYHVITQSIRIYSLEEALVWWIEWHDI